jgi:hypothetical protein
VHTRVSRLNKADVSIVPPGISDLKGGFASFTVAESAAIVATAAMPTPGIATAATAPAASIPDVTPAEVLLALSPELILADAD